MPSLSVLQPTSNQQPIKLTVSASSLWWSILYYRSNTSRPRKTSVTKCSTRLNVNKRSPTYDVGDLVYVRSHNYSTSIVRNWSPKFIGPYRVIEIWNPQVTRIQHFQAMFMAYIFAHAHINKVNYSSWGITFPHVNDGSYALIAALFSL